MEKWKCSKPFWTGLAISQMVKQSLLYDPAIHSQVYTEEYWKLFPENLYMSTQNLYTYVNNNIIYNNENGHNPNVHQLNGYPQNGILFNHKKKGMTHAITQRNQKLNQRGHSQRITYHTWLHLFRMFRIRKSKVGEWVPRTGYWRDC